MESILPITRQQWRVFVCRSCADDLDGARVKVWKVGICARCSCDVENSGVFLFVQVLGLHDQEMQRAKM